MKRYIYNKLDSIVNHEDIFAFAKLSERHADFDRTGIIEDFVYFSPRQAGHGPRIKFFDGKHNETKKSPYMKFDVYSEPTVDTKLYNRRGNPNVFDDDYVEMVANFVKRTRPVLLLVWYSKLDQEDALLYFQGNESWDDMLRQVKGADLDIMDCKDYSDLHQYCIKHNLYTDSK